MLNRSGSRRELGCGVVLPPDARVGRRQAHRSDATEGLPRRPGVRRLNCGTMRVLAFWSWMGDDDLDP